MILKITDLALAIQLLRMWEGDSPMETPQDRADVDRENSALRWGIGIAVLALAVVAGISLAYVSRERRQLNDLSVTNQTLSSSVAQLKTEMQVMADRLSQPASAPSARIVAKSGASRPSSRPRIVARATVDPRFRQMQARLADQEKQLSSTREDLSKTRDDLQGKLDSTRDELSGSLASTKDELNGSIGRTHDDVVALQKRGERNYYEFQLSKSKEFKRIGPLSLSLRKVNTKRKSYDLAMFVDDNQMQKKSINLFEPVWINLDDRPQPVQLVVNQIGKDQIQGYISEPKYKKSELGETASAAPAPAAALKQK
jgi:outer membrane murein-binding lipoprotein Lpp